MAMAAPPRCSFSFAVHQTISLGPCKDAIHGAPGHNRWRAAETPLPVSSQGRNVDCFLNFLSPGAVVGRL